MGNFEYGRELITSESSLTASFVWLIMAILIALIGGITLYFVFEDRETCKKLNGKTKKLVKFLTFKRNILMPMLKISYLVLTIFVTLYSFLLIKLSVFAFLMTLIFGNLAIRISYEMIMLFVNLAKNVKEIRKGIKK